MPTDPGSHQDEPEVTVYVAVTHDNCYLGVYGDRARAVAIAREHGPGAAVHAEKVDIDA